MGAHTLLAGRHQLSSEHPFAQRYLAALHDGADCDRERLAAVLAFVDTGGGKRIDSTTIKDPIVAFVFDVKGLMADISLKGSKFTKLDK